MMTATELDQHFAKVGRFDTFVHDTQPVWAWRCVKCGALVAEPDRETHLRWHTSNRIGLG